MTAETVKLLGARLVDQNLLRAADGVQSASLGRGPNLGTRASIRVVSDVEKLH
jgi:hypothetical protein